MEPGALLAHAGLAGFQQTGGGEPCLPFPSTLFGRRRSLASQEKVPSAPFDPGGQENGRLGGGSTTISHRGCDLRNRQIERADRWQSPVTRHHSSEGECACARQQADVAASTCGLKWLCLNAFWRFSQKVSCDRPFSIPAGVPSRKGTCPGTATALSPVRNRSGGQSRFLSGGETLD